MFSLRLDFIVWLWARDFVPTNKNLTTTAHNESSPVLLCDNSLGSVISLFQHGSAPAHRARSTKCAYGLEQGLRVGRYQPASVLACLFGQVSKNLGEKPETTVDVGADECDVLGNTDFRPHTWAMWCLSNQWNPNCTLSILYL